MNIRICAPIAGAIVIRLSIGLVDLHGRDTDVEHHAVDLFIDICVELRERSLDEAQAAIEFGFHCPTGGNRHRIAIDGDHIRPLLEDRTGIAARAERAIDDGLAGSCLKRPEHFGQENRNVTGRSATGVLVAVARHHSGSPCGRAVACLSFRSRARTASPCAFNREGSHI